MDAYRKAVVAIVGVGLMLLNQNFGLDLFGSEAAIVNYVLAALTAFGVYQAPNQVV
jgi:hypothetical protein